MLHAKYVIEKVKFNLERIKYKNNYNRRTSLQHWFHKSLDADDLQVYMLTECNDLEISSQPLNIVQVESETFYHFMKNI